MYICSVQLQLSLLTAFSIQVHDGVTNAERRR